VTFFLLVLLVGIVDFGRAFYSYIVITNAAREGARYASRFSHDSDGILKATQAEAKAGGVELTNADIGIDPFPDPADLAGTAAKPGDPITVTAAYDADTIIGHIAGFDTVPLRARTQMVVFWTQGEEG
jgi:Flp pilus assembly protein TadG